MVKCDSRICIFCKVEVLCASMVCLWKGARPINGLNQPPSEGRISELAKDIHRTMEAWSFFEAPRRVVSGFRDVTTSSWRGGPLC